MNPIRYDTEDVERVARRWNGLGIAFGASPPEADASVPVDIERALLEAVRVLPKFPRFLETMASWLVKRGDLIAAHRLASLAVTELEPEERAALGFVLESAIELGAARHLRVAVRVCEPVDQPRPLFRFEFEDDFIRKLARDNACEFSLKWGLWSEPARFRSVVVRPLPWLLARHPSLRDRLIRKGDLRVSILETLRHDTGGRVGSESELARLVGATRAAVRRAVRALEREGEVAIAPKADNRRDTEIRLRSAA